MDINHNARKLILNYDRGELELLLKTVASCKCFILLLVLLLTSYTVFVNFKLIFLQN